MPQPVCKFAAVPGVVIKLLLARGYCHQAMYCNCLGTFKDNKNIGNIATGV